MNISTNAKHRNYSHILLLHLLMAKDLESEEETPIQPELFPK